MDKKPLLHILAALAIGGGLWFVMNLEPVWWLAWILPGALFAVALRTDGWTSRGLVALAALIGATSNFAYLLKVMPLLPAMIILLLLALLWVLVFDVAARIVKAYDAAWTVLALPIASVAADTLLAWLTPDGNFNSLAYTQSDILPIAQLASIFGVGGILFLLMLGNSALALFLVRGTKWPGATAAYAGTALAIALSLGYGWWRLETVPRGSPVSFGIASVDDFIDGARSEKSRDVWVQYDAQVEELAGSGAKFVLLPEKIDVLPKREAEDRKAWLARIARQNQVWLVAGVGVDDGRERRNEAWWFAPDGRLVTNYLKHFMAPPEREFVAGDDYPVNDIGGVRYGVGICKDMHFSRFGREFGQRNTRVMLVPAWDFDDDAVLAANITRMRGVESGFMIVRASRDGLLSISDAWGRVLAVDRSTKLPGTTLFATVDVGEPMTTVYTRMGDLPGWLCVLAAIAMTAVAVRRRRMSQITPTSGPPVASG